MALALTNTFKEFYESTTKPKKLTQTASNVFRSVIDAPWMSSGLTANNAFTTTLVLRTFGFLKAEGLFTDDAGESDPIGSEPRKAWALHLGISNPLSLASKLVRRGDPASDFLWLSLSDKTREMLKLELGGIASRAEPKETAKLKASLAFTSVR
jgi:hypothetical protein